MSDLGTARGRIVIDASDVKRAQKEVEQASRGIQQALGAIGIGVGAREFVEFAVAADEIATSYRRQSVAAISLAGSQAKLNELLAAFDQVTGGSVDKATALAQVTNLITQGFADSAEELERFLTGVRGASVAMGKPQGFIIERAQFEMLNQTGQRLNEIGLSMAEVRQRADELRAANQELTQEQAYQQAVLDRLSEKFGALTRSAAAQKTGMENLTKTWTDLKLELGTLGPIDFVAEAMANWLKTAKRDIDILRGAIEQLEHAFDRLRYAMGFRTSIGAGTFDSQNLTSAGSIGGSVRGGGATGPVIDQQKLKDAQLEFARDLAEITRDAGQSIEDATEQYSRQRAETIRTYELGILREAEDFGRQRLRQQRDYERNVLEVMRDSQAREAEWAADLGEQVAKARQESNKRVAEIEAEYAKRRERAQADHTERLRDAAGRLDALAISKEQRNFARAQKEAEEDNQERLDKERASLQERIAQDQKGYQERLDEARKADAERLAEMRLALETQRADEDADRLIRQERARLDHETALAQQDADHQSNLARIAREAEDQRNLRIQAFNDEMIELGLHNVAAEAERKRAREAELKEIEPFTRQWFTTIRAAMQAALVGPEPLNPFITPGEFPRLTPAPNGSIAPSGSRGVTIAPGAVVVYGAIGQSEETIAQIVVAQLTRILGELANP